MILKEILVLDKNAVNPQVEMEIESLKSIYPDECKILKKDHGMMVISMFVPARFGKESYASVNLTIKLPKKYPNEMYVFSVFLICRPMISIESSSGISDENVKIEKMILFLGMGFTK